MSKNLVLAFVFAQIFLVSISKVHAEETPHLIFVSEYIRELGAIEHIRDNVLADLKANGAVNLSDCIRNTTSFQLELQSQVSMLKSMHLNPPFEEILKGIIDFDVLKIDLWKGFNNACATLMEGQISGPKAGIDYGKMAAAAPKITAQLEYIDKTLFQLSPMVFATLIDQKPDSNNHLSYLIITKSERAKLIHDIDLQFGDNLSNKDQNYTVSSASVLKAYLQKDYKCSDDKR